MNLNIDAIKSQTFDAIVVGSGISGGWAAKELTEKGLKVAVLERGREIKHIEGYETALKNPWDFIHRGRPDNIAAEEYWAGMRTGYTANEEHRYLFENDKQNPYIEKKVASTGYAPIIQGANPCFGAARRIVGINQISKRTPKMASVLIGRFGTMI